MDENVFKNLFWGLPRNPNDPINNPFNFNLLPVPEELKNKFKEWLDKNLIYFEPKTVVSFDEFKTKCHLIKKHNSCYKNAIKVLLSDAKYLFYEGFMFVDGFNYDCILMHAFNVINTNGTIEVKDFTAYTYPNISKPQGYYAIHIPSPFINEFLNKKFNIPYDDKMLQLSLIRPYFFRCIGEEKLVWIDSNCSPQI